MKELFEKRVNLILVTIVVMVAIAVGVPTFIMKQSPRPAVSEEETIPETTTEAPSTTEGNHVIVEYSEVRVDPRSNREAEAPETVTETDPREEKTPETKAAETQAEEKPTKATEKPTKPHVFATAAPVENPASYDAQWDAGYLVAIDNPDTSYSVTHVELSDANRDLLERLCMGEFGEGGSTGAALIAQAVRDAMNYYGIDDVAEIIKQLHYTGSTSIPASQSCKDAVTYIFDMDKSAIQHRILYMYNPKLMREGFSDFHESQKYICTFKNVRFFDR